MKNLYFFTFLLAIIIPFSATSQTDTVKIKDSFFEPDSIVIMEGTTVVWEHVGSFTHTTTSGSPCTSDGTWDSGSMTNGNTFSYTFNSSGDFPYFCNPHCGTGMTANVEVTPATDIADQKEESFNFSLYPTPFNKELNIEVDGSNEVKNIAVFNLTGERMDVLSNSEIKGNSELVFKTSKWSPGLYFVKIQTDQGVKTKKVIKQ